MGGSGLSGHSKRKAALRTLFKCNDGDAAPDLWSEYELGGSRPAREAGYWRKRRRGKESESEKGLRIKEKGGGSHNPTQQ